MARQDLLGKHGQQEEENGMAKKLSVIETAAREVIWRGHIAAWEEGELSQRDYCAEHGLSFKMFQIWRMELRYAELVAHRKASLRRPRLKVTAQPGARERLPAGVARGRSGRRTPSNSLAQVKKQVFQEDRIRSAR